MAALKQAPPDATEHTPRSRVLEDLLDHTRALLTARRPPARAFYAIWRDPDMTIGAAPHIPAALPGGHAR